MSETITYDDFKKIELRIGKVKEAEAVQGSKNLIKMKVDIGSEERQIVAGIAKCYKPEEMVGKQIVVVANLAPKIIRGFESKGMLLAATDTGEEIVLLTVDKDTNPGTTVQ